MSVGKLVCNLLHSVCPYDPHDINGLDRASQSDAQRKKKPIYTQDVYKIYSIQIVAI